MTVSNALVVAQQGDRSPCQASPKHAAQHATVAGVLTMPRITIAIPIAYESIYAIIRQ